MVTFEVLKKKSMQVRFLALAVAIISEQSVWKREKGLVCAKGKNTMRNVN